METTLYKYERNVSGFLIALFIIIPFMWPFLPLILTSAKTIFITDRRIYLKRVSGYSVTLPMDSVCCVKKTYWFSRLVVRTASGTISVWGFRDNAKVLQLLTVSLVSRQVDAHR